MGGPLSDCYLALRRFAGALVPALYRKDVDCAGGAQAYYVRLAGFGVGHQAILGASCELFAEDFRSTGFQGSCHVTPSQCIVARDRRACEFFDGTWGESGSVQVDLRQ